MRFRGEVEFWVDVASLDRVEQVIQAAAQAAHAALGGRAIIRAKSNA
jgi:hypothetical protein